jgi:hypothetical protein
MPALSRRRDAARRTVCASQLPGYASRQRQRKAALRANRRGGQQRLHAAFVPERNTPRRAFDGSRARRAARLVRAGRSRPFCARLALRPSLILRGRSHCASANRIDRGCAHHTRLLRYFEIAVARPRSGLLKTGTPKCPSNSAAWRHRRLGQKDEIAPTCGGLDAPGDLGNIAAVLASLEEGPGRFAQHLRDVDGSILRSGYLPQQGQCWLERALQRGGHDYAAAASDGLLRHRTIDAHDRHALRYGSELGDATEGRAGTHDHLRPRASEGLNRFVGRSLDGSAQTACSLCFCQQTLADVVSDHDASV